MPDAHIDDESIDHFLIIRRALVTTILALLIWAPWAAWANHDHGADAALKAALTQLVLSVVITMVMTLGVGYIAAQNYSPWRQWAYSLLGPSLLVLIFMIAGHIWAGTPNWPLTITPSIIVGVLYCSFFSFWHSSSPP